MKIMLMTLMAGALVLTGAASSTTAETADEHKIFLPQEIEWGPAPASVPPGAEAVVLYGDPGEEGAFALRLKLPADYVIPPHTHPKPEVVTVISGTFALGMGETADRASAETLPAGSFFALPPGMVHHVFADEETVIQINTIGPWSLSYVDPADDPRQTTQ
ncbi:MAG TPA: cupin domain-containing protein [Geminicoccaceae bacterium]|nr:cupin domain-containing protein [Geminicoccaceae bacterium]